MKEIKFRAWDIISKSFVELWNQPYNEVFIHSPDQRPYVLMQYTGLKDKNGRQIYEGDILRYQLDGLGADSEVIEYTEEVHFDNGGFELDGCPLYVGADIGEVIGNIYENPEILTK